MTEEERVFLASHTAESENKPEHDLRFEEVDYEPLQTKEELAQTISPETHAVALQQVKDKFSDWLELSGDVEFLEIILAARCDRALQGDAVWLFAISNSGGTKTEIIRSLDAPDVYSLDSLTRHTLISGKVEPDPETGHMRPVKGILASLDNHVLVIKDFTIILSKRVEERDEIFSQLRGLHDGYLEFGFGTSNEPIRIKANIGLIAATTPAIDMYGKLSTMLGERFLKIRHKADSQKTATQAAKNLGKEILMRRELKNVVRGFITNLKFYDYKTEEVTKPIIKLAHATAILRTIVFIKFWRYEVNEASTPNIEYPTRLTKQLLKLAKLLANIRGHLRIDESDLATIQRVARDTCVPNRMKIVKELLDGKLLKTREITDKTTIPLSTAWRELKELEYLGVLTYQQTYEHDKYGNRHHTPEYDGWTLTNPETFRILFKPVSQTSIGWGVGVLYKRKKGRKKGKKGGEEGHSVDVSETATMVSSLESGTYSQGALLSESDHSLKRTCGQCFLWHKGGCSFPGDPNCITPTNNYAEDCKSFFRKESES